MSPGSVFGCHALDPDPPISVPGKAAEGVPNTRAPATDVGEDQVRAPGSWIQLGPVLAIVDSWSLNELGELSASLSLPALSLTTVLSPFPSNKYIFIFLKKEYL